METIRQTLFTGWHFMRWLRLILGSFIAFQAIQLHDTMSGLIAGFLLFQAFANTGCCGSNGCAVPVSKKENNEIDNIEFEEIKTK